MSSHTSEILLCVHIGHDATAAIFDAEGNCRSLVHAERISGCRH